METKEEIQVPETGEKRSIQDYLSLGYLYLLALGIIHDVIFYQFLDINILSYSTVIDVLLSPINYLVSNKVIPMVIIIAIILIFFLKGFIGKLSAKEAKKREKKGLQPRPETKISKFMAKNFIVATSAIGIFSMYFGAGVGGGAKISSLIKSKEIRMSHKIHFVDKEVKTARVLGNNTEYIFYVIEGEKTVSVSPIQGTIKKIVVLPEN